METLASLIEALLGEDSAALLALCDDEALESHERSLIDGWRAIRAGELDGVDPDDMETLDAVEAGLTVVRAERDTRAEAHAQGEAERIAREAALVERDAQVMGAAEGDEPEAGEQVEQVEASTETATEPVPEPVVAAAPRPSVQRLAQATPRIAETEPQPRVTAARPRWELDSRDACDFEDLTSIAERVIAAREGLLSAPPGFADKVTVARLRLPQPEEGTLKRSADPDENAGKIARAISPALHPEAWTAEQRAIVASGGWCAPAQPLYEIPSIVTAARPFRDALPRVGAERGTINFARAARLSTITTGGPATAGAAVTIWENTTDESPGENTKTRQSHTCRTVQEEELGAIVARMRFGNFQQRAFPEDIAHVLELLMAQHARVAEVRLLDALIGDINIDVTQTGVVGTARDVAHHFRQAVAEIRHTERMPRGSVVRAAPNAVLLDMIQADVVMQQASGEVDALLVDEAFARGLVDRTSATPTYVLDTPTGSDAFVTNSDGENLADWPDNFEIPFWPDASAVFADGGELNLGIIRDSTLNNTNDYEVFMETFEGLLWLGPYGKTLTLTTCPNGESQVATDETGALCSGS